MKLAVDLESLIRHLAGREDFATHSRVQHDDSLRQVLDDPSSEASRFLDEIRQKTRSLLNDSTTADPETAGGELIPSVRHGPATARPARRVPLAWVIVLVAGSLAAGSLRGLIWHTRADPAAETTLQTERILGEIRRIAAQPRADRVDPDPPDLVTPALGRLQTSIAALDARMDAFGHVIAGSNGREAAARVLAPPLPGNGAVVMGGDPGPAILSADLAAIRRELVNSEAATTRQIQEMRTVLHELNTVVRRVLSRPQPSEASNSTLPLLSVAIQALINNLQSPSAQIRGEAVERLIQIGTPARSAIPALQLRLNQEADSNVRLAIEAAISVLTPR